jgi:hypothetical protein
MTRFSNATTRLASFAAAVLTTLGTLEVIAYNAMTAEGTRLLAQAATVVVS